jgi:hypothetical protein
LGNKKGGKGQEASAPLDPFGRGSSSNSELNEILTWNCRGMGNKIKEEAIRDLIKWKSHLCSSYSRNKIK